MERNGSDHGQPAQESRSDGEGSANGNGGAKTKIKDSAAVKSSSSTTGGDPHKSPRKRRKVNHACVYCRRSHMTCDLERPCTRCIKRNIGHLCHDEPREADMKKSRASQGSAGHDEADQADLSQSSADPNTSSSMGPPSFDRSATQGSKQSLGPGGLAQANQLQLVSPGSVPATNSNSNSANQFAGFSDAWLTAQNQFHDMHNYNPQYMLAPEVTHEFNLLNDFLNTSLLEDGGALPEDQNQMFANNQGDMSGFGGGNNNMLPGGAMQGGLMGPPNAEHAKSISRPSSAMPTDKTREFYLQAADPSGNDAPEERMRRVLKAKHEAGLLKPFNYVKGYARLGKYMDTHTSDQSKRKILQQLDRFRPKFREQVHGLGDMELIFVEMWFERTLLEYDRVFAAMAVPACCWRRTGEIFRGNKEMAELIQVPVERLRDGKLSLHEILTESSLVRYWEEFGTIAFDPTHDTLLTACALKNPDDQSNDPIINCCFSFHIRRDDHKIPSLIVGNFLPHDPQH